MRQKDETGTAAGSRGPTTPSGSRRRFLQLAAASTSFGLAGCVQGGPIGGGGLQGETISFAMLSPMSGPFSPLGPGQRQAAQVAATQISESDDYDFEIELNTADTETDPSVARRSAQRLIDEGASFMAGAISSSVGLALSDLAANEEVVYTTGGAAMAFTEGRCNAFTFRNEFNTAQQAAGVAEWIIGRDPNSVWLHTADYAYGNSAISEIKRRLDGTGIEIAGETKPALGTSDFGPFISQIAESDADVLAIPLTGGDLITFLRQAQGRGLKEQVDIIGTANFARIIRGGAGADAVAGTFAAALYDAGLETSDNQQFVSAYEDAAGSKPDHFARVGYDMVRVTADGIQAAGSADPTEVADTMSGLEIQTLIIDQTRYRECDHQAPNPIWPAEIVKTSGGERTRLNLLNRIPPDETTPDCSGACEK